MRAPLTVPVVVAALLAGVGCVSVRQPPPTPPVIAQNCAPQSALETLSSGAPPGQSGSATESSRPPTAEQRRALIDKRLNDLRRSQAAEPPPAVVGATPIAAHPKARKSGAAGMASSGNGATARDLPARSGDDVVARRLRKAAEQETDPVLKRKLWQEYASYPKNVAGK